MTLFKFNNRQNGIYLYGSIPKWRKKSIGIQIELWAMNLKIIKQINTQKNEFS